MSDRERHNHTPSPHDAAEALRAAADGECAVEQALSLAAEEGIGDATNRIEFERSLRKAVSRVMAADSVSTPPGLRDSVLAALADARATADPEDEAAGSPIRFEQGIRTPAEVGGGVRAESKPGVLAMIGRLAAVAAVLLLSATLVIVGANRFGGNSADAAIISAGHLNNVTSHVNAEHERCNGSGSKADRVKFTVRDPSLAEEAANRHIGGMPIEIARLIDKAGTLNLRFSGLSQCAVPGEAPSIHVLFIPVDGAPQGTAPVSVFAQKMHEGLEDLSTTECYGCDTAKRKGAPVVFWRTPDDYVLFLKGCNLETERAVRDALGGPENERWLYAKNS